MIDGEDLEDLSYDDLHKNIVFVSPNVKFFNTTIAHTVAYGVENATMDKIVRACKIVGIHDTIRFLQVNDDVIMIINKLGWV